MFLDSQNQFVGQMDRHMRGEPLQLEPGYAELYAAWEQENKEILYKLSAEERTQSFADYVEEYTLSELHRLIDEKEVDLEKNKALKEQANRGQLLLASKDGGKSFDTYLTPEEAEQANPIEIRLLSPTLRSVTNNFEEVREEQTLVHVVSRLRDEHFLVNRAWVENGVVHVDTTHPRHGQYEVEVDLNQPSTLPLEYEFINAEGKALVPETQLPEAYGEAEMDRSLQPVPEDVQLAVEVETRAKAPEEDLVRAAALAGSGALLMAAELGRAPQPTPEQRAQEAATLAKTSIEKPLLYRKEDVKAPTVMASKAAMQARFARQQKGVEGAKKREVEYAMKAREEEKAVAERKKAERENRRKKNRRARRRLAAGSALGAGAAGGLLATLSGTGWFVAHINLFS